MRIIKPKALKHGEVIGICAPASAPGSPKALRQGIAYLEGLGYRIALGRNVYRKRGYLAGSDRQRAADLNELFSNPKVKAIFTVRGGYGSQRILPLLNYNMIKRHPKIFVGYSDITAIQLALLAKTGLVTFSGPMVASEMSAGLTGDEEERFWECLTSTKPITPVHGKKKSHQKVGGRRQASGRLLGGNLSVVAALVGTPYFPKMTDSILLLEEIDERPYRIDRMLRQLKLAGIFRSMRGVVLGKFIGCDAEKGKPSLSLREVVEDTFGGLVGPVIQGLHYGHVKGSLTVPIGIRVRLNSGLALMEFLEPCVS